MPKKTQRASPVRNSSRAGTTKKDEPIGQVRAKSRSKAPTQRPIGGDTEESPQISKLVTFRLEAPQASQVCLAGCFNGWDPQATPLRRNQEGTWIGAVSIAPGEHQYRFVVDGEWQNDPFSSTRCRNEFGTENCVLII